MFVGCSIYHWEFSIFSWLDIGIIMTLTHTPFLHENQRIDIDQLTRILWLCGKPDEEFLAKISSEEVSDQQ